jgi:ubiquinol-cytochrome c reductase cytochrome b subunit
MYISSVLWIGIGVYMLVMAVAFMGYVLPWGQMSYWGATVITNLVSGIPCMVPWVTGGFYISNPTISRYFIIHFIIPAIVLGLLVFHVLYIHSISSSSSTGYNTNNRVHFYVWLVCKDTLVLVCGVLVVVIQVYYGIMMLAHPDNTIEVSVLFTPLHIVPE